MVRRTSLASVSRTGKKDAPRSVKKPDAARLVEKRGLDARIKARFSIVRTRGPWSPKNHMNAARHPSAAATRLPCPAPSKPPPRRVPALPWCPGSPRITAVSPRPASPTCRLRLGRPSTDHTDEMGSLTTIEVQLAGGG